MPWTPAREKEHETSGMEEESLAGSSWTSFRETAYVLILEAQGKYRQQKWGSGRQSYVREGAGVQQFDDQLSEDHGTALEGECWRCVGALVCHRD